MRKGLGGTTEIVLLLALLLLGTTSCFSPSIPGRSLPHNPQRLASCSPLRTRIQRRQGVLRGARLSSSTQEGGSDASAQFSEKPRQEIPGSGGHPVEQAPARIPTLHFEAPAAPAAGDGVSKKPLLLYLPGIEGEDSTTAATQFEDLSRVYTLKQLRI
eukprot:CAMPEP_0173424310 /NCGR_PEP_ID=MMETSP1357-20121228/4245_1 /TAXON_ID=77926 /ORGANISM="Hemiselmis rufescens, Strain PCC563" /LENGTH=157 /DNA_ID=CAMNT_0014387503 /DNA_START=35 /DNA_END=505 /DNA_ORIENTATION=-